MGSKEERKSVGGKPNALRAYARGQGVYEITRGSWTVMFIRNAARPRRVITDREARQGVHLTGWFAALPGERADYTKRWDDLIHSTDLLEECVKWLESRGRWGR